MKINKTYMVESEVGEDLNSLKKRMLDLKDRYQSRIFGIFNGQLYVCYVYYKNIDEIEIY